MIKDAPCPSNRPIIGELKVSPKSSWAGSDSRDSFVADLMADVSVLEKGANDSVSDKAGKIAILNAEINSKLVEVPKGFFSVE